MKLTFPGWGLSFNWILNDRSKCSNKLRYDLSAVRKIGKEMKKRWVHGKVSGTGGKKVTENRDKVMRKW